MTVNYIVFNFSSLIIVRWCTVWTMQRISIREQDTNPSLPHPYRLPRPSSTPCLSFLVHDKGHSCPDSALCPTLSQSSTPDLSCTILGILATNCKCAPRPAGVFSSAGPSVYIFTIFFYAYRFFSDVIRIILYRLKACVWGRLFFSSLQTGFRREVR